MSYTRVIPRDLFNEGNLLKMLGALYIALDHHGLHKCKMFDPVSNTGFDIEQDDSDGSIQTVNMPFKVGKVFVRLYRPLNARDDWPLWLSIPSDPDFEDIQVFDDNGELSDEFKALIV
jgi:hypothetical protein